MLRDLEPVGNVLRVLIVAGCVTVCWLWIRYSEGFAAWLESWVLGRWGLRGACCGCGFVLQWEHLAAEESPRHGQGGGIAQADI